MVSLEESCHLALLSWLWNFLESSTFTVHSAVTQGWSDEETGVGIGLLVQAPGWGRASAFSSEWPSEVLNTVVLWISFQNGETIIKPVLSGEI